LQVNKLKTNNNNIYFLPPEIPGKIITLKLISLDYTQEYFCMLSKTVQNMINVSSPATLENTKKFLQKRYNLYLKNKIIFYFIFDNKNNNLIGKIEIRNNKNKKGHLGSWINENYWGSGRYKEALNLISKLYFFNTKTQFYTAQIHEENLRSLHAHLKYKFKLLKKFTLRDGRRYYNLVFYKKDL